MLQPYQCNISVGVPGLRQRLELLYGTRGIRSDKCCHQTGRQFQIPKLLREPDSVEALKKFTFISRDTIRRRCSQGLCYGWSRGSRALNRAGAVRAK